VAVPAADRLRADGPLRPHRRTGARRRAVLLGALAVLAGGPATPCAGHNLGGGLLGQQLHVSLEAGVFLLEYTVEVPPSVWLREFASDPRRGRPESTGAEEAFSALLMQQLERGLLLLWNRERVPLQRVQGVQEKSGFRDTDFFQVRLSLRGTFPEGAAGTLHLINRNYVGFQNAYSVSIQLPSGYELLETNLQEPGQRFLLDAVTGLPWSLWEGLRTLQIRLRPVPLWRALLGGEREPVRVDLSSVYGGAPGGAAPGGGAQRGATGENAVGRIKAMLMREEPDAGILAGALLLAFLLGAAHAMGPGHGKALVGAYLVGTHGRPLDAVILGLVVTASHVSSVLVLGVASLAASRYFVPEAMFPYIEMASALLLMGLGLWMFSSRWPGRHAGEEHRGHGHTHGHRHAHPHEPHDHAHPHEPHDHAHPHPAPARGDGPAPARWKEMLSLGISGGMVPCPSALAILLIAIALQRVALGICIIVAFSLGLASILVAVGLALVWTRSFLTPSGGQRAWLAWLPVASSVLVFLVGLFMFGRGVLGQGAF